MAESEGDRQSASRQSGRYVFPGDKYVRPGIDDRPDPNVVLSDADKEAIARLAVRMSSNYAEPSATQPGVQATRMTAETAPAVAAATIDAAVPDPESSFLDLRDPMVAADGTRPSRADVLRLKIGFVVAAVLCAIPWSAATGVLMPELFDRIDHASAVGAFCLLNGFGAVVAFASQTFFTAVSDGTRSSLGRRTIWIVAGGLLAGLMIWALSSLADVVKATGVLTLLWCVAQICYNLMLGPLAVSLSDRVPDKFRASADSWYGAAMVVGQTIGGFAAVAFVGDIPRGLGWGAAVLAVTGVVTVAIWPREHSSLEMHLPAHSVDEAFSVLRVRGLAPGFRRVFWSRLLAMTAMGSVTMVAYFFVKFRVVGAGLGADGGAVSDGTTVSERAALLIAWMGLVTLVMALLAARVSGPIAERIGAWWASLASAALIAVGALMPVVMPDRIGVLLFAALAGFGFDLFNAVGQELATSVLADPRTAGRVLGVLNLAPVLGAVAAAVIVAALFAATGDFTAIFGAATVCALASAVFVVSVRGAISE